MHRLFGRFPHSGAPDGASDGAQPGVASRPHPGSSAKAPLAQDHSFAQNPAPQWLVVGLGNPGPRYAATRHNIGQLVLDRLADRHNGGFSALSERGRNSTALRASCEISGAPALLIKPLTYMNLSGEAVAPLTRQGHISPDHLIVIHDELDLPVGKVRLRLGGSENGHNGLKSLTEDLGTRDYFRVRVGISRPPQGTSIPDYVLGPLEEDAAIPQAIDLAAQAVELLISQGLARAQNTVHQK